MNNKINKRIIMIISIIVFLIVSIFVGTHISSTIQKNKKKANDYKAEHNGENIVSYLTVEKALFPMHKNIMITQTAFEECSHSKYDPYRDRYCESNAMDIQNPFEDDPYMYAPYTGRIKEYSTSCNCFAFESDRKVHFPDGSFDFMTTYVLHSEEYDEIKRLMNSNTIISQGHTIVKQGRADAPNVNKYPSHLDIQVHKGKNKGINEDVKLNGDIFAYYAFFKGKETNFQTYIDRSPISKGNHNNEYENIVGYWQEDIYNGNWASEFDDVFAATDNYTSTVKVSCPASIAFEDYNSWDYFMKDVVGDLQNNMDSVNYIVNNFDKINYDDLSDFEKKVYSSCSYEWVNSIPDENENNTPRTITITFDPGENATCDEQQREIAWGTCTYEFPVPRKNVTALSGRFLGWYDESGNEVTCDSIITEDITLYAKWEEFDLPELTTTAPPVTTTAQQDNIVLTPEVIVTRKEYQEPNIVTSPPIQEPDNPEPEPEPETETERLPITVQSISLNRNNKTLNTVGNSTSFVLSANVLPSNAENKKITFSSSNNNVAQVDNNGRVTAVRDGVCYITVSSSNGVSATCEVSVKTAYNTTYGGWSSYSKTPVSPSSTIEVEKKEATEKVLERYRCVYYCTKDWNGNRIYDSKSRNGDYSGRNPDYGEWSFAVQLGDSNHDYWDYTPGELSNPVPPGGYLDSNQAGYNGSNETLYTATWGWDVILVAIKEPLYKDVPVTMYRYRSVNKTPVEYN